MVSDDPPMCAIIAFWISLTPNPALNHHHYVLIQNELASIWFNTNTTIRLGNEELLILCLIIVLTEVGYFLKFERTIHPTQQTNNTNLTKPMQQAIDDSYSSDTY